MPINLVNRLPLFDRKIERDYRGWLASIVPPPLDPQPQAVYQQMLTRLQRDMLLWLLAVGVPISLIFVARLYQAGVVAQTMPAGALAIQVARVPLMVLVAYLFLRRGQVRAAWAGLLAVSLSTILMLVWLLREPSLLVVGLFSLAGPALTMPLRINALIVGTMGAALFLIVRYTFPVYSDIWTNTMLVVATIVCGFNLIGGVLRRFIRQFAITTIEMQRQAAQRGRLEQQMLDLNQKVDHLTALEHDLRQPLRAVQGYLATLTAEEPQTADLTLPAIAAARRADRLINNILDLARAEAHRQAGPHRSTNMCQFFGSLRLTIPGLARYYTDPPVPVRFTVAPLPDAAISSEQLERALLNLLDNALAYSPPDGVIDLRVWATDAEIVIEVRDQGPGIPDQIVQALFAGQPLTSRRSPRDGLGLRQVYSTVRAHGGTLQIQSSEPGTTVRISIPQTPAEDVRSRAIHESQ